MNDSFLPMLATATAPFDSTAHVFEVKWDGIRALAAVTEGDWQLWGRDRTDYRARYPELSVLQRLPAGTVVDGELVVLREGRADLPSVLRRHQLLQRERISYARRQCPVHYVLFDLLYRGGHSLLEEPLVRRRAALAELLAEGAEPRLVFSDGIIGPGRQFFEHVVAQGHEGVMAKLLNGTYRPGKRSSVWQKIKPQQELPCVIIGYTPAHAGFHSLLVAANRHGVLHFVAELTCGFSDTERVGLTACLRKRRRPRPVVPCARRAVWVEPDLYCHVRYLRWTSHGRLRDAVFRGLLEAVGPSSFSPQ